MQASDTSANKKGYKFGFWYHFDKFKCTRFSFKCKDTCLRQKVMKSIPQNPENHTLSGRTSPLRPYMGVPPPPPTPGWQGVAAVLHAGSRVHAGLLRLVFTSDGIGVGVVVGVIRALPTKWKSKIGVASGVISSTESESEELERFHSVPILLMTPTLMTPWKLSCRSGSQAEAEAQEPTNHNARFILRLPLTTPTIYFSLDHKHRNRKRNRKKIEPFSLRLRLRFSIFTRSEALTTPTTTPTPTPSPVKTSL